MATHSSVLSWRIPRIAVPGGLRSLGSQRVGHDLVTNSFCFFPVLSGEISLQKKLCPFLSLKGSWDSSGTQRSSPLLGEDHALRVLSLTYSRNAGGLVAESAQLL